MVLWMKDVTAESLPIILYGSQAEKLKGGKQDRQFSDCQIFSLHMKTSHYLYNFRDGILSRLSFHRNTFRETLLIRVFPIITERVYRSVFLLRCVFSFSPQCLELDLNTCWAWNTSRHVRMNTNLMFPESCDLTDWILWPFTIQTLKFLFETF